MRLWLVGALSIGLLLSSSPSGAAPSKTWAEPDCSQWTAKRTPAMEGWLLGYMSGMNSGGRDSFSTLKSGAHAIGLVTTFCRGHQDESISSAAIHVMLELAHKAGAQPEDAAGKPNPWLR